MTITAFAPIGTWLGHTGLSQETRAALRAFSWLAPADETTHILALTTVFATATIVNLRVLGLVARDRPLGPLARKLLPLTWTALLVAFITGSLLVLNRPGRYFRSDMFIIKIACLLAAVSWTAALHVGFSRDTGFWERTASRQMTARSGAVVAMVFWCVAVVCGRWIAYA